MIKGAIFDLDGTLLDSMAIWESIGNDYLSSIGIETEENLSETFKTFTLEQSAEYYRINYGITLSVREIITGINNMIDDYYRYTVPLKKGVAEFLEKLSQKNIKMCIATITDKELAEAALIRLNIRNYFIDIITATDVEVGKDSPQIYRAALEYLGTEKHETFVFEDSFHALMTAKNDGFPVVAVYDEHEINKAKMQEKANYYIADYARNKFFRII